MDSSARIVASDAVPFSRIAWIAGAIGTAVQPARLGVGLVLAILLWVPGLAWDALTEPRIDPPGLLAEPWDDTERADAQRTLRRLAVQHVPERDFEGAQIPADQLAAALARRADELGRDPEAERVAAASRRAAALAPLGSFQALALGESDACAAIVDGALALDVRPVAAGIRAAALDVPLACIRRDTPFACVFGAWFALVLSVAATALARMEAVQVAGRGILPAREGLRFGADRWSSVLAAWIAPAGIVAALGLACVAWGFLFRTEAGGWLGALLYVVPLAVGAVAGIAAVVAALGAPGAPAAVACDGLDSMDASQRGAIYFLARPILWAIVHASALAVAVAGFVILRVVAWALTSYPATMVDLGAGGAAPVASLAVSPERWMVPLDGRTAAIWAWVVLAASCVTGAAFSLLAGTLTRAYLVLREACDGQPAAAIWPFDTPLDASDPRPSAAPTDG